MSTAIKNDEPPPLLPPPPAVKAACEHLARTAYQAYHAARGGKAYDASDIPPWDETKPEIREAWVIAGIALLGAALAPSDVQFLLDRLSEPGALDVGPPPLLPPPPHQNAVDPEGA